MSENLFDLLAARFPEDRSRPCFILADGREISYGALETGAAQAAGRLVAEGVQPGDRVALQAEKSPEAIMVYLGVLKAGAVFLPLNSAYTEADGLLAVSLGFDSFWISGLGIRRTNCHQAPCDKTGKREPGNIP